MRAFLSYARRDAETVSRLHDDLTRARHDAWFDRELDGGQQWWDTILEQIRSCELFVFVLSPSSVASRACRAELGYALALGRPLLPVMVRDVNPDLLPAAVGSTHIVDLRQRNADSALSLMLALGNFTGPVPALPFPLPDPPPAPMSDLGPLHDRLLAADLGYDEQLVIVREMQAHQATPEQHRTLRALAEQFRARPDLVASVARELDVLLRSLSTVDEDLRDLPQRRRSPEERDPDAFDLLRSMTTHIRGNHFTPILGFGMTDSILSSRRRIARQWSRTFEFPMASHHQSDLAEVAQFVTVMTDTETLLSSLAEYIVNELTQRWGLERTADPMIGDLLRAAWRKRCATSDPEAHMVLASLPCPIYIVTHPFDLMTDALREAGKDPVVELCRWRRDCYDWPESVFDREPGYTPSAERPLVYHVFGAVTMTESLVVTEDDYLDFLVGITEDRSIVPAPVRRALADSALLMLGFELEDLDVRVLLRTLVSQEGAHRLQKYRHVAAQVDLSGSVLSENRARKYLERYFGQRRSPSIDIYWGSVEDFVADLHELWTVRR